MNEEDLARLENAAVHVMVSVRRPWKLDKHIVLTPPSILLVSFLASLPPNAVSQEQRAQAEAVFINLRKLSFPYEVCKHIFGECGMCTIESL